MLQPIAHVAMLLFTKTLKQGSQTSVFCAVAKEVEGQLGAYYDHCRVKKPIKQALNDDDCRKLWNLSMRELKLD